MSNVPILSVYQRKGGVGKTTLTSNLGQVLSLIGKRVLLIDNDSQGNLTTTIGLRSSSTNLYDLYKNVDKLTDNLLANSIIEGFVENLYCITSSLNLDNISPSRNALSTILNHPFIKRCNFDTILIDNCAATDPKTKSAITASNIILIPVQLEQLSITGLKQTFEMLTNNHNVNPSRIFIIRSHLDRTQISQASSMAVKHMFPDNVISHQIPRCTNDLQHIIKDEKSLFISKTRSKLTGCFLDLSCDLFGLDKTEVLNKLRIKINQIKGQRIKQSIANSKVPTLAN